MSDPSPRWPSGLCSTEKPQPASPKPQTFQRQHGLAHLSSPHHPPSPAPPDLGRNRGDRERQKAPDTESLDPKTGAPSSPTATPATATTRAEPCQGRAVGVQTTEAPCAQGRTSRGPRPDTTGRLPGSTASVPSRASPTIRQHKLRPRKEALPRTHTRRKSHP